MMKIARLSLLLLLSGGGEVFGSQNITDEETTTSTPRNEFSCVNENLSDSYLDRLRQSGLTAFIPLVYYHGQSVKVVSTTKVYDPYIYSDQLCVNGAESNPSGLVQLYDDGTNGDDVAGDGIFSRSCVHYCNSKVNYNDIYGFAYGVNLYGQELVALDPSKKGTIPFKEIDTPLTPGARSFATSHAFFFADVDGKYFPNLPHVDDVTAFTPNHANFPNGKSVAISALLQIFGDVFDIVTVSLLEGKVGAGIYKWQNWDRRGGPQPENEIGNIETCAMALTGFPTYRMVGAITSPNPADSGGFQGWIHEVIHSVGGFEFHNIYGGARKGDGMHVPASCTTDHSDLQGPLYDWVKGYPHEIPRLGGLYGHGLRLEANANCNSCKQNELAQCCSFRYENRPITKQEMVEHPELCTMSPIMQYISGFIDFKDVPWNKRTYYCMGSDTDGGCGTEDHHEKQCMIPVNDDDPNAVTSTFVQRFTLNQLVKANGGKRFPTKKFDVIRHAPVIVSARPASDAEMVFYTLFWRQQEIATEPWERGVDNNNEKKYPYDAWNFHSRGHSIIHSRLHGIDCGANSDNIPSCNSSDTDVCADQPCAPGAICTPFDGQPLCMCREGLVGDGYECAFPTETIKYDSLPNAYSLSSDCFPDNNLWTQFIPESSIPPYPGGKVGYSPTSCFDFGVCPVGWRCDRREGCLQPLSSQTCEDKGYNKGQCLAIGCCHWSNSEGVCLKKEGTSNSCPAILEEPNPFTCKDLSTECYFECKNLNFSFDRQLFSQEGNCGAECYDVPKDCRGIRHPEVYLLTDGYYTNHKFYSYGDQNGPFKIQGEDKNMYQRCFRACELNDKKEYGRDKFLLNIVKKNDFAKIKSCNWLKKKPEVKKRKICIKKNLTARGYKPAMVVCPETCGPYLDEAKAMFLPLN